MQDHFPSGWGYSVRPLVSGKSASSSVWPSAVSLREPGLSSASFGGLYLQRVSLVMSWGEINLCVSALKEWIYVEAWVNPASVFITGAGRDGNQSKELAVSIPGLPPCPMPLSLSSQHTHYVFCPHPHTWLHAMSMTWSHMSPFFISLPAGKGDTLGLRETPPSLPPPTAVICFLLTLKASWREEEKGKRLKQIPGCCLMFLNIKHFPAVWKPRWCCTHQCLGLMRNKEDPACIPTRHSSRQRWAAQEVQCLDPDADVCGFLSGGVGGRI